MQEPLIPGGYIIISRKLIESEIWSKPPLYVKVWLFLLTKAQHTQYKKLNRGQLWTSIPEIIEACKWKVGARVEKPSKDQIYRIINWLRKGNETVNESDTQATMITTMKATHGMLINIDNYSFYQESKNYESCSESNNEIATNTLRKQPQTHNINKNEKNEKNENEDIPYVQIISFLNTKAHTSYKPATKKTKDLINARWNEGFRIDDFKRVIGNKVNEWAGTDLQMYLRPETLFGTKFESYLNQPFRLHKADKPTTEKMYSKIGFFSKTGTEEWTPEDWEAYEKKEAEKNDLPF